MHVQYIVGMEESQVQKLKMLVETYLKPMYIMLVLRARIWSSLSGVTKGL